MNHRILFLHGLESSSRAYKARYLREVYGDAVIAPDWRVSRHLAQCRAAVCEAVRPYRDEPFIVVGSSMGGFLASICAHHLQAAPVGLIYVNPVIDPSPLARTHFDDLDRFFFTVHDIPTTLLLGAHDTICDPTLSQRTLANHARIVVVDDDHRFAHHYRRIAKEIDRMIGELTPPHGQDEKRALWHHSRRATIDGDQ